METLTSAKFEEKGTSKLPEGAAILKKTVEMSVEQIENGFIIRKSYDIKYSTENNEGETRTDWEYFTKKWFSKTNPITIDTKIKGLSLADKFE